MSENVRKLLAYYSKDELISHVISNVGKHSKRVAELKADETIYVAEHVALLARAEAAEAENARLRTTANKLIETVLAVVYPYTAARHLNDVVGKVKRLQQTLAAAGELSNEQ